MPAAISLGNLHGVEEHQKGTYYLNMELVVSIWHGSPFFILFCHELHNVYIDSEKKKSWIKSYNLTADFIHSFTLEILLSAAAAAAAKSLQSCPTLCNPIDGSPLGSSVPGILQARTLEWVAISFSNAWKWKGKVKSLCRAQLFETPWTAPYQAPPPMGFSRQEYTVCQVLF